MVGLNVEEAGFEDVSTERGALWSADEDLLDDVDIKDGKPAGSEILDIGLGEQEVDNYVLEVDSHEHFSENEASNELHPVGLQGGSAWDWFLIDRYVLLIVFNVARVDPSQVKKIEKMTGPSSSRVMVFVFPLSQCGLHTGLKDSDCSQTMLFWTNISVLVSPIMTRSCCWKLSL